MHGAEGGLPGRIPGFQKIDLTAGPDVIGWPQVDAGAPALVSIEACRHGIEPITLTSCRAGGHLDEAGIGSTQGGCRNEVEAISVKIEARLAPLSTPQCAVHAGVCYKIIIRNNMLNIKIQREHLAFSRSVHDFVTAEER